LHSHHDVGLPPSGQYNRYRYATNIFIPRLLYIHISSTFYETESFNMPVPKPATTDKSTSATSSSASAQTAHDVEKPSTQAVASTTHSEKTAEEREAERVYEERIEEEYAKREGGA
jgi:hypothetical protein